MLVANRAQTLQTSYRGSIAEAFSKASLHYDKHANIQKAIAEQALTHVHKNLRQEKLQNLIDLGCGTAWAASSLSSYCRHWIGVDISLSMLKYALNTASTLSKQEHHTNYHGVNADAQSLPFTNGSIDFVYSSMALQWCEKPKSVLAEVDRVLNKNGKAVLAIMTGESFSSLHRAWESLGLPSRLNRFHSTENWIEAAQSINCDLRYTDNTFFTEHANVLELLKSIKSVGANTPLMRRAETSSSSPNQYLSKQEIKRLNEYLLLSSNNKNLSLDYHVIFIELYKK